MVKRKVIWSKTAFLQRKNILIYWLERNKSNSYPIKLLSEIKNATQVLCDFPEIGKPTDIENIRVYVMGNYSIFYTNNDIEIRIIVFWDNRQNPEVLRILISEL